jgi:hypothetical protein
MTGGSNVYAESDTFFLQIRVIVRQESDEFEIKLCGLCRVPQQAATQALTRDLRSRQALTVPYCVVVSYGSALCIVFCCAGRDLKMEHSISIPFCGKLGNNPTETH